MIYANCIMEDSSGRIWVGSSTGLYCFSGDSSTPVGKWSARDGLADNDIMSIIEDGRAETAAEAFSLMADDLAALDSTCVVSSDEYVMVMAVKPLFLVHGNSSHMDDD